MATQRRHKHEHALPPAPANLSSMTRISLVSAILRFAFPLPPYQVGMLGNTVRSTSGDSIRCVPQVPQRAAQMMTQRCKSISPASYDQWQRMCRLVKAHLYLRRLPPLVALNSGRHVPHIFFQCVSSGMTSENFDLAPGRVNTYPHHATAS